MPNLPNELREKRVVATGPNQGFTVRGVTGFYTEAATLDYGVNVQGNKCGVYGECVHTTPTDRKSETLPPDPTDNGIGVCGVGDDYGVFGKGFLYAGVHGENGSNGTGVFGLGLNDTAIGVAGISKVKKQGSKSTGGGIGIVGATESGQGFGVVGLGMESLDDTPRSVPMPIIDIKGNLLFGDKLGSGIGVVGASRYGTGVHGASQKARGGVIRVRGRRAD